MYKLHGTTQNYAWGGKEFLYKLLNIKGDNKPLAEYWMGAHISSPSQVVLPNGNHISLIDYLDKDNKKLPYLLKVLDVKDMLSIQVHPTIEQAIQGYDKEDSKGIALNDKQRNYKDKNHKPEVGIALSDFYLLHGFKAIKDIKTTIEQNKYLKPLEAYTDSIQELYAYVMKLTQEDINMLLEPLKKHLETQNIADKLSPDFWAKKAFQTYTDYCDRGIISIYIMNIVKLNPMEGIFQDAGILHAYLEGQCVELMANSDNVLRGGLTPKHIDVSELLKIVKYTETIPNILQSENSDNMLTYKTPAKDFEISVFKNGSCTITSPLVDIWFCYEGELILEQNGMLLKLIKGESAVMEGEYIVNAKSSDLAFLASTPKYNS